ncbi:MAG: PqqD family protein [Chloroflexi bacterium]|nr:PqqD family protein [Chloroflexota bacterium]MBV9601231.1 PqqD family protein [Chloroflexota bacterium]
MSEVAEPDCTRNKRLLRHRQRPSTDQPTHRAGVDAYPVDDELVVYDSAAGRGCVLNSTAARIWTLSNGSRTTSEVAEVMASIYGLEYETTLTDVCECVEQLRRAGLLAS